MTKSKPPELPQQETPLVKKLAAAENAVQSATEARNKKLQRRMGNSAASGIPLPVDTGQAVDTSDHDVFLHDQDVPDLTESFAETLVSSPDGQKRDRAPAKGTSQNSGSSSSGGSGGPHHMDNDSLEELDQEDLAALLPEVPSSSSSASEPDLLQFGESEGQHPCYQDVVEVLKQQMAQALDTPHGTSRSKHPSTPDKTPMTKSTTDPGLKDQVHHDINGDSDSSDQTVQANASQDGQVSSVSVALVSSGADSGLMEASAASVSGKKGIPGTKPRKKRLSTSRHKHSVQVFTGSPSKHSNRRKRDRPGRPPKLKTIKAVERACATALQLEQRLLQHQLSQEPAAPHEPCNDTQEDPREAQLDHYVPLDHVDCAPNESPDSGIQSIAGSPADREGGCSPHPHYSVDLPLPESMSSGSSSSSRDTELNGTGDGADTDQDGPPVLENMKDSVEGPLLCEHQEQPVLLPVLSVDTLENRKQNASTDISVDSDNSLVKIHEKQPAKQKKRALDTVVKSKKTSMSKKSSKKSQDKSARKDKVHKKTKRKETLVSQTPTPPSCASVFDFESHSPPGIAVGSMQPPPKSSSLTAVAQAALLEPPKRSRGRPKGSTKKKPRNIVRGYKSSPVLSQERIPLVFSSVPGTDDRRKPVAPLSIVSQLSRSRSVCQKDKVRSVLSLRNAASGSRPSLSSRTQKSTQQTLKKRSEAKTTQPSNTAVGMGQTETTVPVKRKRGRPRKNDPYPGVSSRPTVHVTAINTPAPSSVSSSVSASVTRGYSIGPPDLELDETSPTQPCEGQRTGETDRLLGLQEPVCPYGDPPLLKRISDNNCSADANVDLPLLGGQSYEDIHSADFGDKHASKSVPQIRKPKLHDVMMRKAKKRPKRKKSPDPQQCSSSTPLSISTVGFGPLGLGVGYFPPSTGLGTVPGAGFPMQPFLNLQTRASLALAALEGKMRKPGDGDMIDRTHTLLDSATKSKLPFVNQSSRHPASASASTSESNGNIVVPKFSEVPCKKKKKKQFKSKHKNVVDPMFLAEVDTLSSDFEDLRISPVSTKGFPSQILPFETFRNVPLPAVFRLNRQVEQENRKKELHLRHLKRLESRKDLSFHSLANQLNKAKPARRKPKLNKLDNLGVNNSDAQPKQDASKVSSSEAEKNLVGNRPSSAEKPMKRSRGRPRKNPIPVPDVSTCRPGTEETGTGRWHSCLFV